MYGDSFVGEMEVETDVGRKAEILEEGTAGLDFLAEVAELELWRRNLDDFGETGDEGGHSEQTVAESGIVQCSDDSRNTIVDLVTYHADDALVGCFLGQSNFGGE